MLPGAVLYVFFFLSANANWQSMFYGLGWTHNTVNHNTDDTRMYWTFYCWQTELAIPASSLSVVISCGGGLNLFDLVLQGCHLMLYSFQLIRCKPGQWQLG